KAGVRILPQRWNFVRFGGFGDAGEARLLQFPVDPDSRSVSPTNHGQPSESAGKCDKRRHRSILVHSSRPDLLSPKPARPAIVWCGTKWRAQFTVKTRISPILPGFRAPRSALRAGLKRAPDWMLPETGGQRSRTASRL